MVREDGDNMMWNTVFDEKLALNYAKDQMGRIAEGVKSARGYKQNEAQPAAPSPVTSSRSQATLVEAEPRSSGAVAAEA